MKKWTLKLCLLGLVVSLGGCQQVASQIVGTAMQTTTQRVGEEIGDRIAGAVLADLGPRMIRTYTIGMMQLLFYQGGYDVEMMEYEPGDYTVWQSDTAEYGQIMERAFLRREENGMEWWRLEAYSQDPDTGEEFHLVMEGLFEPREDGSRYIRRLRVQYPDSDTPEEVPITKEDAANWLVRGQQLTPESMEGMRVGSESVTVPAGTFSTVHYKTDARRYQGVETNWWLTEAGVPGQVVKMVHYDTGENVEAQRLELVQYGSDARESVLGVF